MDKKKRPFDVTASSLVDLKAELYRKQEQFKQQRLGQESAGTGHKPKPIVKKPNVWVKQNSGVSARAEKDAEQLAEDHKITLGTPPTVCVIAKKKKKFLITLTLFSDEETEGLYLVDFAQKIIDRRRETQTQKDADSEEEERTRLSPVPPPQNPDEEWVDFVDALGRSRRCMKKDLPDFMKMDFNFKGTGKVSADLLSEDMRRELQRQEWEREEEEAMKKPVGPVHYENIRAQDEDVTALSAPPHDPPEVSRVKKVEVEIEERRDTKPGVPHVREWDRGKESMFSEWKSRRQSERESEFAPPSTYFTDQKRPRPAKTQIPEKKNPEMSFSRSQAPAVNTENQDDESRPPPAAAPTHPPPPQNPPVQPQPPPPCRPPVPPANLQYLPPPFYPPFTPPHFICPPYPFPHFPAHYQNQYPPQCPPPMPSQFQPQVHPQPIVPNQPQVPPQPSEPSQPEPTPTATEPEQPLQGPSQSLDDILSFYRNAT
uniref:Coiled-coil domain containing 174 n=1 Tax=Hippocampus comes TaxID=109280 RepID=A0A3Q2YKQ7_HIPCM